MSASHGADLAPDVRRRRRHLGLFVLALLAYVPALASSPGRMPADTKLYLYLDPGGLVGRAASTFEADQFAGWVPHQQIAYLWPSGPWFWFFEAIAAPDWIAHRLWIATIMFAAGAGVRWAARLLGLAPSAATVAALVYQLSPFLLAYISRTSLLLLPWAALGWIVALTIRAATSQGVTPCQARCDTVLGAWRAPALIALIVASVGAVNATALALIIPAPALWLIHAAWQRAITWRRAAAVAARVTVLCATVSLWWIGMLVVQARHGADVLSFSETLADVSRNSTGTEVLRALGYWLFYQRDPVGPTTTASLPYLISIRTIAISFLVVLVGLVGVAVVSWSQRRFAALLIAVGAIIAVGVHPIDSPSPLMSLLTDDSGSGLALALRSSTRAIPVFLLGIALGTGALVSVIPLWTRWWRRGSRYQPTLRTIGAVAVGLLALVNLPVLYNFDLVDPAIDRDEDPPAAWLAAAARVDETADGGRVLQLPGAEFGAFRWGYTADQPLVGLAETPLLTRDLLPLGSAPAMDLLYALDDRFQEGTVEAPSVAPVARLLGADTVLVTNDMAFERYRTARPEIVDALLTGTPGVGLGAVERFGEPAVNVADVAMIDPTSLLDDRVGRPTEPLSVVEVEDAVATIRAKTAATLMSGSGDGIVDAAAAGLLDGHELLRYTASLDDAELGAALDAAERLIVTDSNRDRAHHWRGSQDVHGHTEPGGSDDDVLVATAADQRLDLFGTDDPTTQTVALQDGPVTAIASSYGEPFAYRPEDRAVMAIDGDATTAWSVADHGEPRGERIRLELAQPHAAGQPLVVHQIPPAPGGRFITSVQIEVDDQRTFTAQLGTESFGPDGTSIVDPVLDGATSIEITIDEVSPGDPAVAASRAGVGFTEIDLGLQPTVEYLRVPTDALDRAGDVPLTFVLSRLRVDPNDPWRSDPEPSLNREFTLPSERQLEARITLRLDHRASDAELESFLRPSGPEADAPAAAVAAASDRLVESPQVRGAAAVDGDRSTAWITPFDGALGGEVRVPAHESLDALTIVQPDGDYSPITALTISDGTQSFDVEVPPPDATGQSTLALPGALGPGEITVRIAAIDPRITIDRRYGDALTLPAGIAEISAPAIATAPTDGAREIVGECVDDLLTIDGEPVGVSYATTVAELVDGQPVEATLCTDDLTLTDGEHRIASTRSSTHPLTVDRIVLADTLLADTLPADTDTADTVLPESSAAAVATTVLRSDPRHRTVEVAPCPDGCWLVLGEGHNDAWSATVDGTDLGPTQLVDGGFNGWWLPPTSATTTVEVRWTAQGPVTWGLLIGAATTLVLLAIVALTRRRRSPAMDPPTLGDRRRRPMREPLAAAVLVGASAVLIAPVWALVAVIPALFVLLVPVHARPVWLRRPFELAGLATAMFAMIATVVIERGDRPSPNAGWTLHFDHLNGAALFALVALAVGTLFAPDAERRP